jgi:hypothetical protein
MNSFDQLYIEFLILIIIFLIYQLYKTYHADLIKEKEIKAKAYESIEYKKDILYFTSEYDRQHPLHPMNKKASCYDVEKIIKMHEKDKKKISHKKLLKAMKNGLISGGMLGLILSGPHGVIIHGVMMASIQPIILIAKHSDLLSG